MCCCAARSPPGARTTSEPFSRSGQPDQASPIRPV
jgi:hypothetical protein